LIDDLALFLMTQIQTIALLLANKPTTPSAPRPTLIVCPLSTLDQWNKEIKTKVAKGALSVLVYYGPKRHDALLSSSAKAKLSREQSAKKATSTKTKRFLVGEVEEAEEDEPEEEEDEEEQSKGKRRPQRNKKGKKFVFDEAEDDEDDDFEGFLS